MAAWDNKHHNNDGQGGRGIESGGGAMWRPKKRAWGMTSTSRMSPSSRGRAAPPAFSGTEEEERNMGECSFFYYSNMDEEIISSESRMTMRTNTKMTTTPVAWGGGGGVASINWRRNCAPSFWNNWGYKDLQELLH